MKTTFCSITSSSRKYRRRSLRVALRVAFLLTLTVLIASSRVAAQTVALPDGREGEQYNYALHFEGGIRPVTWSITSGQPPNGITMNSSGLIAGVPAAGTAPETYQITVTAIDSNSPNATTVHQNFSLKIVAAAPLKISVPTSPPVAIPTAFVLTSSSADEETIALDQVADPALNPVNGLDPASLQILDPNALMTSTVGTDPNAGFKTTDYCVVHVIKWKPASDGKSEPAKQTWALLERVRKDGVDTWERRLDPRDKEQHTYVDRIFGSKRVIILPIHIDTPPTWDIKYKVAVNRQTPTPVANVLALAGALSAQVAGSNTTGGPKTVWGARLMLIRYTASELVVKVNAVTAKDTGEPVEQSKEYAKNYTNEGRYHWDVSIGLPVKTLRQLTFVSDATNGNKITTSAKERQDAYGFFNYFPKAVDLKSDKFLTWPHFLLGVPLAGKPLQRPILGIGTGVYKAPIKFNIFAGVVFIRERVPTTLSVGQQASQTQLDNDLHTRWVRKFTFGINFPVSQITQAIKGKK